MTAVRQQTISIHNGNPRDRTPLTGRRVSTRHRRIRRAHGDHIPGRGAPRPDLIASSSAAGRRSQAAPTTPARPRRPATLASAPRCCLTATDGRATAAPSIEIAIHKAAIRRLPLLLLAEGAVWPIRESVLLDVGVLAETSQAQTDAVGASSFFEGVTTARSISTHYPLETLRLVVRRLTISGVSEQRVVRDPSKPADTVPMRWLETGPRAIGDEPSENPTRAIATASPRGDAARSSHDGNHATETRPGAPRRTAHVDHRLASCRGFPDERPRAPRWPRARACPPAAPRRGGTARDYTTPCPARLGPVRHRNGRRVRARGRYRRRATLRTALR